MSRFNPVEKRSSVSIGIGTFTIWLTITAIAAVLSANPDGHGTHQQLGLPPCPSVVIFDRPCPGCGLTTSWTALVHGDFPTAFTAHPFGPLLYLMFTAVALVGLYSFIKKQRFDSSSPKWNTALAVFAFVFFSFGVFRWITTPGYASEGEIKRFVDAITRQQR